MAEIVIPEGFGNAVLAWQMAGKTNPVTTTIGYASSVPGGDVQVSADTIYDAWTETGAYCDPVYMSTTWTFLGVTATERIDGELVQAFGGPGFTGTSSVVAFPPINCAILARKLTASVGRSKRGRFYLPNLLVQEGEVDNMGRIVSGTLAVLNSLMGVVFDEMNASSAKPVVLHSAALEAPTAVTAFPVQGQMATQRRRLRS